MNSVKYLLFNLELLNYLFRDMFVSVLECYELTHISWFPAPQGVTHGWAGIVTHWLCNQKHPYVAVVQLLTFLNLHFIIELLLQSYFS